MPISAIPAYDLPPRGSWPSCRARWKLDPHRSALLVHDMQAYFLRAYGEGHAPLPEVVANVERLRAAAAAARIPVFFSVQPQEQTPASRGLLMDLWGSGLGDETRGAELGLPTPAHADDILVEKHRYSAFHGTRLSVELAKRGRDQLLISGVYGHIGCLATAVDGFMQGIQPFLVSDAVADFSREDHEIALRQVARTCGVVLDTSEVLESTRAEPAS